MTSATTFVASVVIGGSLAVAPVQQSNVDSVSLFSARVSRAVESSASSSSIRSHVTTTSATFASSQTHSSPVTESADPVEKERLVSKVKELSSLSAGALGPGSRAVAHDVLADLRSVGSLAAGINTAPTADGSVCLEWSRDNREYTAEIGSSHRLFMCVDDVVTDELEEAEVLFSADLLRHFMRTGSWSVS